MRYKKTGTEYGQAHHTYAITCYKSDISLFLTSEVLKAIGEQNHTPPQTTPTTLLVGQACYIPTYPDVYPASSNVPKQFTDVSTPKLRNSGS